MSKQPKTLGGAPHLKVFLLVQKITVDKVSVEWSKSTDKSFLLQVLINTEEWRKISIEFNFLVVGIRITIFAFEWFIVTLNPLFSLNIFPRAFSRLSRVYLKKLWCCVGRKGKAKNFHLMLRMIREIKVSSDWSGWVLVISFYAAKVFLESVI